MDRHRVHRVPHPRMEPELLQEKNQTPSITEKLLPMDPYPHIVYNNSSNGTTSAPSSYSSSSASHPTPGPSRSASTSSTISTSTPYDRSKTQHQQQQRPAPPRHSGLTLEELALLPLCGVPAYRAVRTFAFAFSAVGTASMHTGSGGRHLGMGFGLGSASPIGNSFRNGDPHLENELRRSGGVGGNRSTLLGDHEPGRRRRALVLRGHDGVGAMVVQMLARRGWRVSVHAPGPVSLAVGTDEEHKARDAEWEERYMENVEERVRNWGGEEVIFDEGGVQGGRGDEDRERGAVVKVLEGLCVEAQRDVEKDDGGAAGDAGMNLFDAVLDTVGGKEVWELGERLLRISRTGKVKDKDRENEKKDGGVSIGRYRKVKGPMGQFTTLVGDTPGRTIPSAGDHFRAGLRSLRFGERDKGKGAHGGGGSGKVGYAWVNVAQDVDWEGEDVRESVRAVLRMAIEDGVRPWVHGDGGVRRGMGRSGERESERVIPFERAPEALGGPMDLLGSGGTVVVKIVG